MKHYTIKKRTNASTPMDKLVNHASSPHYDRVIEFKGRCYFAVVISANSCPITHSFDKSSYSCHKSPESAYKKSVEMDKKGIKHKIIDANGMLFMTVLCRTIHPMYFYIE